jgi:uncharacterized protein YcfJ
MSTLLKNALALAGLLIATQAAAQATFYEHDNFQGRSFTTQRQVESFSRHQFNDRASSAVVGRDRWEVCEDQRFGGRCVVLRQGNYPSLASMGLNDRVSSARTVAANTRIDDHRYAPGPKVTHDYRRRRNERLYEANVTAVHAVIGPPEQRCWMEQEQVSQERSSRTNVPATLAGAVIGGILGHQVGSGTGRTVATVGGAAAGALVGAHLGRDNSSPQVTTQNVQRCATSPSQARPEFWDVTYRFRGQEHHVQLTAPPGPTIRVNRQGEPRA